MDFFPEHYKILQTSLSHGFLLFLVFNILFNIICCLRDVRTENLKLIIGPFLSTTTCERLINCVIRATWFENCHKSVLWCESTRFY